VQTAECYDAAQVKECTSSNRPTVSSSLVDDQVKLKVQRAKEFHFPTSVNREGHNGHYTVGRRPRLRHARSRHPLPSHGGGRAAKAIPLTPKRLSHDGDDAGSHDHDDARPVALRSPVQIKWWHALLLLREAGAATASSSTHASVLGWESQPPHRRRRPPHRRWPTKVESRCLIITARCSTSSGTLRTQATTGITSSTPRVRSCY
jgi:hypothetical protein